MQRGLWTSLAALLVAACSNAQPTVLQEHDQFFIISKGGHAKATCADCHAGQDSFSQVSCDKCHTKAETDATHSTVTGYSAHAASCVACHLGGTTVGWDHEAFFPVGAGAKHHEQRCTACHVDAPNWQTVACTACHEPDKMATSHVSVGGYRYETQECLRCHADAQNDRIAQHRFSLVAGTAHFGTACSGCHPLKREDKPWAQDFSLYTCLTCHTREQVEPAHRELASFNYETGRCRLCHPGGQPSFSHQALFPKKPGSHHEAADCRACHSDPTNSQAITCLGCHEPAPTAAQHQRVPDYELRSSACLRCHAEAQVDAVATHTYNVTSGHHRGIGCLVCHPFLRADKPWAADFGRYTCRQCHPNSSFP
jgi:hypothetical protein